MKITPFLCVLLIGSILAGPTSADQQLLYLASQQEKTVVVATINEKTGALEEKHKIALPGNLGPMAFSPDRKFIYAAMTNAGDLAAAVAGHGWAKQVVGNPEASPSLKRGAIRTAILLARAQKEVSRRPTMLGSRSGSCT